MNELVKAIPRVALAVYAHPDDAEVSCGGTLALWAAAGCEVHAVVATDGGKGTADPTVAPGDLVLRRQAEMVTASEVLGISGRVLLGYPDGELQDGPELREDIVRVVREIHPDVVVCPDPTAAFFGQEYVNHRDHRAIGWACLDAVAPAAALPHYFPQSGPPHRVETIYLSGTLEPDVSVDITSFIDIKIAAVRCHASQVGPSDEWIDTVVRRRGSESGVAAGVAFAESFRRQRLSL